MRVAVARGALRQVVRIDSQLGVCTAGLLQHADRARLREYPPVGLGGGAASRGVRHVMLCGAQGFRVALGQGGVGAAGVGALTFAGCRGGVCVWGWASADVPQAPSFSPRLLGGLSQAPEDIQEVLGCGELAWVDSLGMERIGQHRFPCSLQHPSPRCPESAGLRRLSVGPADQALEGVLCLGPFSQLRQLRVGPALPPHPMGGAVALGGGVSVGVVASGGVMGTGCSGGAGGVLIFLCPGAAWGVGGARAYADPWICRHGHCLGVGLGSARAVVAGHLLDVSRHRGLLGGWAHLYNAAAWPPHCSGPVGGGLWALGAGFEWWLDEVHRASALARSAMKVVAAVSVTAVGHRAGCCCRRVCDGLGWL